MSTMYSVAAHPTVYRGRHFRSRLEARWAAFFDQLGWRWEYEPFDLHGWVPDFVLIGAKKNVLVEVKPITEFHEETGDKIKRALKDSPGQEALLVGCCLPQYSGIPCVGWLIEWYVNCNNGWPTSKEQEADQTESCWGGLAPFAWYKAKPEFADFTSQDGAYHGRLTGEYDGGHWGGAAKRIADIDIAWGHAHWVTMFRGGAK